MNSTQSSAWSALLPMLVFMVIFLCVLVISAVICYRILAARYADIRQELSDTTASFTSEDEIGDLTKSFGTMEKALRKYIKDLTEVTAEKERISAELDVATRIQSDMLPTDFEAFRHAHACDIHASMIPAREVGGDFYDFFTVDEGHLGFVMADVSGKGVPAALFMAISKALIRQRAMEGGLPSQILADVNEQLCLDNKELLFVTVWLGILDLATGTLTYANAGHEYPVVGGKGGFSAIEEENDPPLAISSGLEYTDRTLQIDAGESLILYTDGIPEAKNPAGERFGMDGLMSILSSVSPEAPCSEVINSVTTAVDTFAGGVTPFDDITILMYRR